jgi:hypothetical protein
VLSGDFTEVMVLLSVCVDELQEQHLGTAVKAEMRDSWSWVLEEMRGTNFQLKFLTLQRS